MKEPDLCLDVWNCWKEPHFGHVLGFDMTSTHACFFLAWETEYGWLRKKLKLDQDGVVILPVCLRCGQTGKDCTDRDLPKDPTALRGFLEPPDKWKEKMNDAYTYGDALRTCIESLRDRVFTYNPEVREALERNDLLIIASCPDQWKSLEQEITYRELLRKIFNCQPLALCPAAAARVSHMIRHEGIDIDRGIVLYDFGYDITCTYVGLEDEAEIHFKPMGRDVWKRKSWEKKDKEDLGFDLVNSVYISLRKQRKKRTGNAAYGAVVLSGPLSEDRDIFSSLFFAYPGATIYCDTSRTTVARGLCLEGIRMVMAGVHPNRLLKYCWKELSQKCHSDLPWLRDQPDEPINEI